jgi:hypothetical protein
MNRPSALDGTRRDHDLAIAASGGPGASTDGSARDEDFYEADLTRRRQDPALVSMVAHISSRDMMSFHACPNGFDVLTEVKSDSELRRIPVLQSRFVT